MHSLVLTRFIRHCWLLFLLGSLAGAAQPAAQSPADSVATPVETVAGTSVERVVRVRQRPQFNVYPLDYRSTFVRQSPVLALGGAVGFKFSGKHLVTVGYYWLSQHSNRQVTDRENTVHTISSGLKLSYINFAYTWSFIHCKRWEVGLPIEVGYGISREAIHTQAGRELRSYNSHFVPLQIGITGDWKITRWAGLNLALGYRVIPVKSTSRADFDGVYYNYGVNLYTGNILDDYRAWRKRRVALSAAAI